MKGISSTDLDGSRLRIAVITTRWNEFICSALEAGALEALKASGVEPSNIETYKVPGAFELPLGARAAADTGRFDAIVCLGAVIQGETPHFDFIAGEAARGIMDVGLDSGIPVTFGVITADNEDQARERAGGAKGNKGVEAAEAAVEMALLRRRLDGISDAGVGFTL
ncbi:MAG TPA: 6,7-dimethyl-8-ribityllumazine synthase [Rhodothermales bacterium]|nr:6,7-dimethyl-8-ribityllumazine synthase [Rhodothermales bacterium]